jgi:hypothetical protein
LQWILFSTVCEELMLELHNFFTDTKQGLHILSGMLAPSLKLEQLRDIFVSQIGDQTGPAL